MLSGGAMWFHNFSGGGFTLIFGQIIVVFLYVCLVA
jgi:hypothetical protein